MAILLIFSDLAIYTGASMRHISTSSGESYDEFGDIWTSSTYDNRVRTIDSDGEESFTYNNSNTSVIRPAIKISPDLLSSLPQKVIENGVIEVEFGQYPQTKASDKIMEILMKKYYDNTLQTTSKTYTLDSQYKEIIYEGKKYIALSSKLNRDIKLKDGTEYAKKSIVFMEVKPVKWLYDKETNILIAKDGLLSGIKFGSESYEMYETISSDNSDSMSLGLSEPVLFFASPVLYYLRKSNNINNQQMTSNTYVEHKDFYHSKLYSFLNNHMLDDMLSSEKNINLKNNSEDKSNSGKDRDDYEL